MTCSIFDVATGLLRRWDLQIYQPWRSFYVRFQFDDYREVGSVKFPHCLYVDFYRATFRYTKVCTIRRSRIRISKSSEGFRSSMR